MMRRGNHIFLGRHDYTEPNPISDVDLISVAACNVPRVAGKKTWWSVSANSILLGYVTTQLAGQFWRTPEMTDWIYSVSDWNRSDPPHAAAILNLMKYQQKQGAECPISLNMSSQIGAAS